MWNRGVKGDRRRSALNTDAEKNKRKGKLRQEERKKEVTVKKIFIGGAKRHESVVTCGLAMEKGDTEKVGKKEYDSKACTAMQNVAKQESKHDRP